MHWTDSAIIISICKYGESSGIVTMLTENHGLFKGLVRGIQGKNQRGIYQTGNMVEATWRGRLSEHLGNFTAELASPNAAYLMSCPKRLAALNSICSIIDSTLPERDPALEIFLHLRDFITQLINDGSWIIYYPLFELELLSHVGFGLDLTRCVATGNEDKLVYISPKSGCSISEEAGKPYHDKLFKMPDFFINRNNPQIDNGEINNALAICAYFLEKYIFRPHNEKLPAARLRFAGVMQSKN